MHAPREELYPEPDTRELAVVFRVISRRSWDELQGWQRALPGSRVEHLMYGLYVLTFESGRLVTLADTEEVDHVDGRPD